MNFNFDCNRLSVVFLLHLKCVKNNILTQQLQSSEHVLIKIVRVEEDFFNKN